MRARSPAGGGRPPTPHPRLGRGGEGFQHPTLGPVGSEPSRDPPVGGRRQRGFTLLEVVAAVAILSMALSSGALAFGAGARLAALNAQRTAAAGLLRIELERSHGLPFNEVASRAAAASDLDPRFRVEVRVADAATGGEPEAWTLLKAVEATVRWQGPVGREASLSGSTLVARREQP